MLNETRGVPEESWIKKHKRKIAGVVLSAGLGMGAMESGKFGVKKAGAEPDRIEHVQKKTSDKTAKEQESEKDMNANIEEVDITPGDYDADTNEVYEYGQADTPPAEQDATKLVRNEILKNEKYLTLQKGLRTNAPSFNFIFDTFGEDGSAAGKIYSGSSKKELYRVAFSNAETGASTISVIGDDGKEIEGSEEKFNSATDLAKELERRKDSGILD